MTKTRTNYACRSCGATHPRWQGRCDTCGEWSSLVEERTSAPPAKGIARSSPAAAGASGPVPLAEVETSGCPRRITGIREFDRVLGGGLVEGSAILVAGDPGIGKSTLLLQVSGGLAASGGRTLYVSGEESPAQTRLRADRLNITGDASAEDGLAGHAIHLLAETDLAAVLDAARRLLPDLLVIDSIQTLHRAEIASAPGSVAQVRECAAELTMFAKATGIPVILIGHVTKTGDIAGPHVLSHVVDTVLSFEGDRYHAYRMLRAVKNRFGTADELGIFEMAADGLREVASPAGLLSRNGSPPGPGSVVVPAAEGNRVLLVEIQALASLATATPARRRVTGLDARRLDLLLAVLEKNAGLHLGGQDVFVNVVGGVRVEEPGADLAAALAVASSFTERPFPRATAAFGEVGLRGEVRPVPRARARVAEASKLGFGRVLVPPGTDTPPGIQVIPVETVAEAIDWLGEDEVRVPAEERSMSMVRG